jgi:hypothetical protein
MRSFPHLIHCSLQILYRVPPLGKRKRPTDLADGPVYLPRILSPTETVPEETIMPEETAQGTLVDRVRAGLEIAAAGVEQEEEGVVVDKAAYH